MKLKRIAALFAALVFAFAVAACDDGGDDATPSPEAVATEAVDDAAVEEEAAE